VRSKTISAVIIKDAFLKKHKYKLHCVTALCLYTQLPLAIKLLLVLPLLFQQVPTTVTEALRKSALTSQTAGTL
jgi:hypothetical protein